MCLRSSCDLGIESDLHGVFETIGVLMGDGKRIIHIVAIIPFTALSSSGFFLEIVLIPYCLTSRFQTSGSSCCGDAFCSKKEAREARKKNLLKMRKSLSDVQVATEAAALAPPSSSVTAGVIESSGPTAVRGPDAGVEASMAPPSFLVLPLPPTRGSLPESIPKEAALEASRCSSDNRDRKSELSHSLAAYFSSLAAYFSSLAAYFCFMSTLPLMLDHMEQVKLGSHEVFSH
ncbi:unnamed protein product [Brassica napus]|uniref:(rape) hypothetical protein n=1 Tax=Brassica napus TaxID=3708 RepID=A0A816JHR6_BRANA|nr:unnamed protein product [Brassica napus]